MLLASMAEKNVTRTRIYTTIIIAAGSGCHKISVFGRDVQDELSFIKGSKENTA